MNTPPVAEDDVSPGPDPLKPTPEPQDTGVPLFNSLLDLPMWLGGSSDEDCD
jgi:hypothetical protein